MRIFKRLSAIALCLALASCDPVLAYDPKANQVKTATASFNKNLSSSDTDVQKALDTIDNLVLGGAETDPLSLHLSDIPVSAGILGTDGSGTVIDNTSAILSAQNWTKTGTTLAPTTAGDRVLCGGVADDGITALQTKNLFIAGINGTTTTTGQDMNFYSGAGATDSNGKGNRGGNIAIGAGSGGQTTVSQSINGNATGG
ncbi:MAG: hypothetical protein WCO84_07220, partial [bacterium]